MLTDTVNTQAQSRDRRILIVDDNAAILKLLGSLFSEEGIEVRLASSATSAKALLDAEEGRFDLVLTDIAMPGESGFELLQWIKHPNSRYSELPVLLMTAQLPEAEYRLKGLALGAVDYVVRPLEPRELVLRSINAINHFQRVKHLEHMLQDAGNLATVGRLLAASSHEIKNLAALVNLASDRLTRLLSGITLDPQAQQLLRTLTESSSLLTDVARNTASLLDPPGANVRPIDTASLVLGIVSLMQTRVQPNLITTEAEPLWSLGHANRVKQVLINLILNASEAINELSPPEGGRIDVIVKSHDDQVAIEVHDNGIGLTTPGIRTEFAPFDTTKKLRGGQGLGLWLCARLLDGMGGQLSLRSDGVGKGAVATITLPVTAAPAKDDTIDLSQYFIN
jgi:signal transduction histidine kinase